MKKSELRQIIREELQKLNEGFSKSEQEKIKDAVHKCFKEKGNKGVRDYDTLNGYLGKLSFEVDAADIEIGGWEPVAFNRQVKSAEILLQGKYIGTLTHY